MSAAAVSFVAQYYFLCPIPDFRSWWHLRPLAPLPLQLLLLPHPHFVLIITSFLPHGFNCSSGMCFHLRCPCHGSSALSLLPVAETGLRWQQWRAWLKMADGCRGGDKPCGTSGLLLLPLALLLSVSYSCRRYRCYFLHQALLMCWVEVCL